MMEYQNRLDIAREILAPVTTAFLTPEPNRIDVVIPANRLLEAVGLLRKENWGYLSAITGLDHAETSVASTEEKQWAKVAEGNEQTGFGYKGLLEVLYHFCSNAAVITLRVQVSHERASIPSICSLVPSATLYERELLEMFGIDVQGTPNREHMLLPDDWPDHVYPLRKSFTGFDEDSPKGVS
jgi:NADH:ubiquinone oxidoreductase subunit C